VAAAPDLAAALMRAQAIGAGMGMSIELPAQGPAPSGDLRDFWDLSGREVGSTLHEDFASLLAVDLQANPRLVLLWIKTPFGPMLVQMPRARVTASNPHQLLVVMGFASVLMTAVAFAFLRNQLVPITRMAAAAEAFGRGQILPYKPRGALEVRAAGTAFLDMRSRIERQIEQRTLLLSGVSHDLRAPLTRMKLGLSLLAEDAEIRALQGDVEDMERLVDEFLAFVRGAALEETALTDPAKLVAQVVDKARRGGMAVTLGACQGNGEVRLRPQAVMRALENLLGNAVRYGTRGEIGYVLTERSLRLVVEDDGPGIPEARREEAMLPFTRLDAARNPNKGGGVGLGLSIAADIARTHGGTLRLGKSATLGGLKAEMVMAR
jgi:two-component system osmolarity sensor histidine kinase EnvZ